MIQQIMKKRYDEDGFTLVELLIVIIILAILAAIVVFAVGGITNNGQAAACNQDAKTLQSAEEAYFAQNHSYVSVANLIPTYIHQASSWYSVNLGNTTVGTVTTPGTSYTLATTGVGGTAGCPANP